MILVSFGAFLSAELHRCVRCLGMDGDASTVRLSPSFDTRYNFALAFQCYRSEVNQHPVAYARCTEEWPVCLARGSCRGDEGLSIDKTALVSIDSDARTWAKHITRPIEAQKPHKVTKIPIDDQKPYLCNWVHC